MTCNIQKNTWDRKLQADSRNSVKVENPAKNDQVMGPPTLLTFEKKFYNQKWPARGSGSRYCRRNLKHDPKTLLHDFNPYS